MFLSEILSLLEAEKVGKGEHLSVEIGCAFASDLMSDVLALASPGSLLITGLTNIQIIRTASMLDMPGVVFVRGKRPAKETIELADKMGLPIILTNKTMFETCGILYAAGIKSCFCPKRSGQ